MSKLVLFLMLGVCVMAVHMAPTDEEVRQFQEVVNSLGPEIQVEVQKKIPGFNWDRWWIESRPVLTVISKIVKPLPENKDKLCRDDEKSDAYMNSHGPQVEFEVKKFNKNFKWDSWWPLAKHVLRAIGDVVSPVEEEAKKLCGSDS